jgi:hypothetical protein
MKQRAFKARADASERIDSAKRLIRALLALRHDVREDHVRELLSVCIWKLTEAEPDHKHRTRFRSVAALKASARDLQLEAHRGGARPQTPYPLPECGSAEGQRQGSAARTRL